MTKILSVVITSLLVSACGDGRNGDRDPALYDPNQTVVAGAESGTFETPDGDDCIELESGACIRPQDECGDDGTAQVIVDGGGEVLRTRCVDGESDFVYADEDGIPSGDDGLVLVTDGTVVEGDVSLGGSDTVVVGDGDAVIDGDVTVEGDNNLISGVRIMGNLNLTGSGATAVDCVVEGNVRIPGNGGILANCVVFGSIEIPGNAARLAYNAVQGDINSTAMTLECDGNESFSDDNDDLELKRDDEITGDLACGGEG